MKIPPNSVETEQAVLAAIMINSDALIEVQDILTSEMFYRREHRLIWGAMIELNQNQAPVDVLTISNYLKASNELKDAGGIDYLGELIGSNHSAANIGYYATVIRDKAIERQLIGIAHGIADNGYHGTEPVLEKLANAQTALLAIQTADKDSGPVPVKESMKRAVKALEKRYEAGGAMVGLPTGFRDLDHIMSGLKDGEMIIVAARPSCGKSTISQNTIEHSIMAGKHVLFFSVEMPEQMVMNRHFSSVGGIPMKNITSGKLVNEDWDHLSTALARITNKPYHIDDYPSLTSAQILPRAQRVIMKSGKRLDLVVVDYIQKLRDKGNTQNDKIQEISGNIKHAARVLGCPVIALSQLSRECERRPNKRPILSDLKDSGALEADADVVIFIYRDELYNDNSEFKGSAEIIVAKNRNGPLGTTMLTTRFDFARFDNFIGHPTGQSYYAKKSTQDLDF